MRDDVPLPEGRPRMTPDPQVWILAALTMAIGYTMFFSGLKKHMLELKRPRRTCPACGRRITGAVCREH
jgi:hypothetical protein